MGTEIELKLIATEAFDEDDLVRRLSMLGTLGTASRFEQRDVYLDTQSEELRAAGLSARVRERGGTRAVMIKPVPIDPGLVMRRSEVSEDLEPDVDPKVALARLLERELGVTLAGRLAPCLELVTDRTVRMLARARATVEVCVDRVSVLDAAGKCVGTFREVEAELADGDPSELDAIAQALADASLRPSGEGKYARARALAALPPFEYGPAAPQFDGDTPMHEVARAVCRHQLALMRAHEPGTRVGLDIEQLHKMRVASRRLRTALRVFGKAFRKKDREHLATEVKWIGARLGSVRDLDVHMLALEPWRERLGAQPQEGWALLAARLAARRAEAQAQLVRALDDPRWRALCERASSMFASSDRASEPIGKVAPALVGRRIDRFSRGVERFRETHAPADAHRLRILGKRLRYATEFLRPLLSAGTVAQLKRLSAFQDTLGDLQDTVQAGAFVRAQAADEPVPPALAVVLERIARWADEAAAGAGARVEAALEALQPHDFAAALQRELARPREREGAAG